MSVGQQGGIQRGPGRQQGGGEPPDWQAVKGDVADMAGAAVEKGRTFIDSARDQATDYVDRRKNDVAQSIADLANSLRESGKSLGERQNIQAFIDSAAQGLDQLADTVRSRSFAEVINEVEVTVRRRPGAVAATTLAAGFLLARFIKSSAEGLRDHEQQSRSAAQRDLRGATPAGRPQASQIRA